MIQHLRSRGVICDPSLRLDGVCGCFSGVVLNVIAAIVNTPTVSPVDSAIVVVAPTIASSIEEVVPAVIYVNKYFK